MLKIGAYHSPTTLAEAVSLLAEDGRTVIAGGTDLLVNPRYMVGIREVVDIRKLGLDYIREENGWLHIGAGTTMRTVARHQKIQKLAQGVLARSAAVCGSPNIRNMATLVGNVASALPSADTPPALLALDAQAVFVGMQGERIVPLDSFFVGPAKSVRERELIRELRIPPGITTTFQGTVKEFQSSFQNLTLLLVVALGTWGIAVIGTVFSALTVNLRLREVMLPLLVYPMMIPCLMAAMKLTNQLVGGDPLDAEAMISMRFLIGFDVIYTSLALMLVETVLVG